MINNEILSFIKDQLGQGTTKDQVKNMLVGQGGWDEKDVEEAFETINFSGTSYPSVLKNAMADEIKAVEKDKNPENGFAPASELMKSVSSDIRPTIFSPGSSHMEQPKSMEPSMTVSSFPSEIAPRSKMDAEPMKVVSENSRAGDTAGSNALSSLRARIASGVSAGGTGTEPVFRPTIQPVVKEPAVSPQPFIITPATYAPPVVATSPFASNGSGISSPQQPQPRPFQNMGQNALTAIPSLNKTPPPSVMSAPRPLAQAPQPMAVFSKNQIGGMMGNSRLSPTPAQLAALQGQKQKGGRFLIGFLMFIIGIIVGGISMNAYMKGLIKTDALNGIVDKGMNLIGLGTTVVPEAPAVPAKVPATPPVSDGGS